MMDRLQLMAVFVAVVEEQGFAGAARRLKMSPPAVTRAVAALEQHLGIKLLNRTTRYVRVTDAGQRYFDDVRRIIADVEAADDAAVGVNAAPRGQLAVTAPILFGKLYVMPGIVEYLQRYPDMQVSAVFLDRVVNLLEEGLDVGIRIGALPDSSLRAVRVGAIRRVVCAAPSYLAAHGAVLHPDALRGHSIVAASAVTPVADWKFAGGQVVRVTPRLTVNSNDAAIAAVLSGYGITRLLSYQIAPYLASGQLQAILSDYEPEPLPIHIIHREGHSASAKVRTFVDLMVARLRGDVALAYEVVPRP